MEFTWLSRWQPQLLAILRIVAALLFIEHGTAKLFAFPVAQPGAPDPLPTMLVVAAVIELIAGTLVTLGLFTRLAAFIAAGEMAAAYFIGHFPRGFWPVVNMGEASILFTFVFLYIASAGPGAWSIDGARMRNMPIR
ncbi:MAG TPA: DoxX family protein [Sphingomicrobium sp.]